MENMGPWLKTHSQTPLIFLKWVAISVGIGFVVGGIGTAFSYGIVYGSGLREQHGWMLYLLPVAGVAIVFLYHILGLREDKGTNLVISSIHSQDKLPIRMLLAIFVSTIITHTFGGSAGREGAALQIGGSSSNFLGRVLHMNEKDAVMITMCGMSAGFSALFSTPIAASVFAMEVISVGIMHYSNIVPCFLAALVAKITAGFFGLKGNVFDVSQAVPNLDLFTLAKILGLGILCALVSILFCVVMHGGHSILQKLFKNPYLRVLVGAGALIGLTFIFGTDYNGVGEHVIDAALTGHTRPEAFLVKLLFTAITLGCGFKGGEIVPSFFVGATFGNFVAPFLGLDPIFGAAVGMIAVFCGVTNCPLASILLSVEMLGVAGFPFYALAVGVSYMLSGYHGLYSEQKILYSKIRPEFINKKIGH